MQYMQYMQYMHAPAIPCIIFRFDAMWLAS